MILKNDYECNMFRIYNFDLELDANEERDFECWYLLCR